MMWMSFTSLRTIHFTISDSSPDIHNNLPDFHDIVSVCRNYHTDSSNAADGGWNPCRWRVASDFASRVSAESHETFSQSVVLSSSGSVPKCFSWTALVHSSLEVVEASDYPLESAEASDWPLEALVASDYLLAEAATFLLVAVHLPLESAD